MLRKSFNSIGLIFVSLVFLTNHSYSQKYDQRKSDNKASVFYFSDRQFTEREIGNLLTGIKSENLGLRKSAIYLAGLYGISEAVPALIEQLKNEENAEVKILTALVLLRLEDPKGIEAIEYLYKKDENVRVKKMSKAILDEFKSKLMTTELSKR